jgi:hypothetical protein
MNNRTLELPKAFDGLRPAFSAHVRWSNMGHPPSARWPVLLLAPLNCRRQVGSGRDDKFVEQLAGCPAITCSLFPIKFVISTGA